METISQTVQTVNDTAVAVTGAANAVAQAVQKAPDTAATVINTAVSTLPPGFLDRLGDGMFQMFDKAGDVLKLYGPDAAHLALSYIRVSGAVEIASGLMYFVIVAALAWGMKRIWFSKRDKKTKEVLRESLVTRWENGIANKKDNGGAGTATCSVVTIAMLIASLVLTIVGVNTVFNPWNWIKIAAPEVGVVHEIYINTLKASPAKK